MDFIIALVVMSASGLPTSVIQGFSSMDVCQAAIVDMQKQLDTPLKAKCIMLQAHKPTSKLR